MMTMRTGSALAGVVMALMLAACGTRPRKVANVDRAPTVGECLWARGASVPMESGAGVSMDFYAVQSCEAEVREWHRRRAERQAKAEPNP